MQEKSHLMISLLVLLRIYHGIFSRSIYSTLEVASYQKYFCVEYPILRFCLL